MTIRNAIPFTAVVNGLPSSTPFVGPETLERQRGARFQARIGANESAFGVCTAARDAMTQAINETAWYGDPENFELRKALARKYDVSFDCVCVDAGIDSLLGLVVRMLVTDGAPVVTSLGAYPTFNYHVAGFGGKLVTVPYRDDHEDTDALLAAAEQHHAPVMYMANPDNPMGTWHNAATIQSMIDNVPTGTVLALDEAYAEFAPEGVIPAIDTSNDRVMRFRTFSKAYGMAGARVGYAIAHPDLIAGLNKIRNHFAVNRIAQAGALASINDPRFLMSVASQVSAGRKAIYQMAADNGLSAIESATNFVAIDLGSPTKAKAVLDYLIAHDVFVRMPGVEPLNRCVRIGVGTHDEHQALIRVFGDAVSNT